MITGKLEITIKINELPNAYLNKDKWWQFEINCGQPFDDRPRLATVILKPQKWQKLVEASQKYPQWVCVLTGTYADDTVEGFILGRPAVKVFEKKARETEAPKETKQLAYAPGAEG